MPIAQRYVISIVNSVSKFDAFRATATLSHFRASHPVAHVVRHARRDATETTNIGWILWRRRRCEAHCRGGETGRG